MPVLSRNQRVTLELLRKHREQPPTLVVMMREATVPLLRLTAIVAAGIWFGFSIEQPVLVGVFAGLAVSALAREVNVRYRYVDMWPVWSQVVAWNQVDLLLTKDGASPTV